MEKTKNKLLLHNKTKERRAYPGSLTSKIVAIIIGLVAGTILLCWILNNAFLEKYYVMNQQNTLWNGFERMNDASEDGTLYSSDFDVEFDNL